MGFACKIAGHKWNGCTCTRCGERRDEGHDWQLVVKTGYPRSCKNKCSICGKEQPAEHDWNGCVCTRCGTTRSEGHILGRWERTNAESHARCCTVCGRARETEPHTFGPAAKCRRKCTVCGYEIPWHEWRDGACTVCGIKENDYFGKKILFGEMDYDDPDRPGSGRKALDHVTDVTWLSKIALSTRKDIDGHARLRCAWKLQDIAKKGGEDAKAANKALRDLALSGKMGWDGLDIAKSITDPDIASDPKLVKYIKDTQKASDDYDRTMIASDSRFG